MTFPIDLEWAQPARRCAPEIHDGPSPSDSNVRQSSRAEMTAGSNHKANQSGLARFLSLLPLYLTDAIVVGTWLAFGCLITIKEVLLRRHDIWRFIEQAVILNGLFGLTILSLITASNRHPGSPDPSLAPAHVGGKRREQAGEDWDDDIPLRSLRAARDRQGDPRRPARMVLSDPPSDRHEPLPFTDTPSTGSSYLLENSPFPLNASPFVPTTATDAGEDDDDMVREGFTSNPGLGDQQQRLSQEDAGPGSDRSTLFAKNSSGGIRWCSKCDAWKPDRCHHCRHCRRCTLKMDHHCVWLGTCVGFHNHKPFLLFVTYGTFLALYIFIEGCVCTVQYFSNPRDFATPTPNDMGVSEIVPVSLMFLAILGGFFTLTIGGLAGYHWYLVCRNKTTLEDITHTYPSALIGKVGGHASGAWRGDHLLSRAERIRLREEASSLNVYDLGWRRNLRSTLCPDGRLNTWALSRCLWPPAPAGKRHDETAGHYFDHDPVKLERLRELTAELRLGVRQDERRRHDQHYDQDEDDDDDDNLDV